MKREDLLRHAFEDLRSHLRGLADLRHIALGRHSFYQTRCSSDHRIDSGLRSLVLLEHDAVGSHLRLRHQFFSLNC